MGLASVAHDGGVRAIAIEGVRPDPGAFEYRRYPHGCRVQLIQTGRTEPGVAALLDFLASEEGIALRRVRLCVQ